MLYSSTADIAGDIFYSAINGSLVAFNLSTGDVLRAPALDTRLISTHLSLYLHYHGASQTLYGFAVLNSTTYGLFSLDPLTGQLREVLLEVPNYNCNFHSYGFDDVNVMLIAGLGSSIVDPQTCLDGAVTYFLMDASEGELISQSNISFYDMQMTAAQDLVFLH